MTRQQITQRLLYLRNWELVNIFLLPGCIYVIVRSLELRTSLLFWYSTALIALILAQGTLYWQFKLNTIQTAQSALPAYFYRLFTTFKYLNLGLLAVYLLWLAYTLVRQQPQGSEPLWATLLWLLALLEQINYYHYQLMHDTRNDLRYLLRQRRLRRAPLADDLARTKQRP